MASDRVPHAIAPGQDGYNLLSKRNLFRIVLLKGSIQHSSKKLKGPLVLEAKDGSYRFEHPFAQAHPEGEHLVFDFYLRNRDKTYQCYIADAPRRISWTVIPKRMIELPHIDRQK